MNLQLIHDRVSLPKAAGALQSRNNPEKRTLETRAVLLPPPLPLLLQPMRWAASEVSCTCELSHVTHHVT